MSHGPIVIVLVVPTSLIIGKGANETKASSGRLSSSSIGGFGVESMYRHLVQPCELVRFRGSAFVPKGLEDSARGFNPGNRSRQPPAL
jgi:hypothetical protein